MCLTGGEFIEAIVRLLLPDDELDLPACRVDLSNGVCNKRVRDDVRHLNGTQCCRRESDCDQTKTTAHRAPSASVVASLERHLDFDVEHV